MRTCLAIDFDVNSLFQDLDTQKTFCQRLDRAPQTSGCWRMDRKCWRDGWHGGIIGLSPVWSGPHLDDQECAELAGQRLHYLTHELRSALMRFFVTRCHQVRGFTFYQPMRSSVFTAGGLTINA